MTLGETTLARRLTLNHKQGEARSQDPSFAASGFALAPSAFSYPCCNFSRIVTLSQLKKQYSWPSRPKLAKNNYKVNLRKRVSV